MKKGKSLTQLAAELERQADEKQDLVVDTSAVTMNADGKTLDIAGSYQPKVGDVAQKQIGTWAGIPQTYYRRLQSEAPSLLADNVNHWLAHKPKHRMFRLLDGRVRAFLSDRYRRMDNDLVAKAAFDTLNDTDVVIASSEVTDKSLYIKATFPRLQGDVKEGDVVQLGVMVKNSEVGLGTVTVLPLVYRLVCTNGMVVNDAQSKGLKKSHLGGQIVSDEIVLSQETVQSEARTVALMIRDTIRSFTNPEYVANMLGSMRDAAQTPRVANPVQAIELLSKDFGLGEGELQSATEAFIRDRDYSKWGAVNAITQIANNTDDYERASELEVMGGNILNLHYSKWTRYATAA